MNNIKLAIALLTVGCGTLCAQNQAPAPADTVAEPTVNLDDLVIVAKKELVKSDGAKTSYAMSEDESSKGQNLLEALRKVPMVQVDAQDNITINGSSSFKIYVNGKEDAMLEANYQRIFKSMPADMVQNVEVITEPGAKYDAEGFGGILNLITESKQRNDGYSGSLSASYGNTQGYVAGYINAKYNKFNVSANVVEAFSGFSGQKTRNTSQTEYLNQDANHLMETTMDQELHFNMTQGSLNMSWEPNSHNLFTWGGSFMGLGAGVDKFDTSNRMFNRQRELQWAYDARLTDTSLKNRGATAEASYRYSFNESSTHRIILAYLFNFGINKLDYISENTDVYNYPSNIPWRSSNDHNYTREHTVQLDYSNPFGDGKHTLDAGFKGIFRHNSALGITGEGASKETIAIIPDQKVDMNQNQDILAGYLSYSGSFTDKIALTAGIRYEHTIMGLDFHTGNTPDFKTHINDWVPNAALTYNFAPANNLRLAYQMRIWRPSIDQTNPYRTQFGDFEIHQGNPDLTSERNHVVSLTYTNYGRVLGGNVKLQYSQNNNAIINYSYYDGLTEIDTYSNNGRNRVIGLSGYLNWNITNNMSVSINGGVDYTDMRAAAINASNHGWSGNYNINWNWKGPSRFKFNAYGGQSVHRINLQGHSTGWYYYGVGVSRSFLKEDALTIGVSAGNFLQAYSGGKYYTNTANTRQWTRYSNRSASVSLNISWNFGHLREQVKSTGLDLNNDDKSETKSRGGISM